jgi:hypothetical protein
MSTRGISKKNARLFRVTHAVFVALFGGVAAWLFATSQTPVLAWILSVAAFMALVDVVVGWRQSRD